MNLRPRARAEPPEKKKRKKTATISSSPPPTPPSFSLLPDEITENFLARVPRSYYPKLSLVSKTFRSIISSTDLYTSRSRLGNTQQSLYVCIQSYKDKAYYHWNTLSINPSQTKKKNKIGSHLLVTIPSSNFATAVIPTIVGSDIYVIGGYSECSNIVKVLDCRSHTWRDAPCMRVARQNPKSCVYDGKIYVMGDIRVSSGEVFDIKTQTWKRLPKPGFEIPNCCKMAEFKGKIYYGYMYTAYASYDPKQNKWEKKSAAFPSLECVMDNVSYSFCKNGGQYNFWWRDINGGDIKEVKGLVSLGNRYKRHGGPRNFTSKVTSCGGKLYVMWQSYTRQNNPNKMMNIWCAEISVEKRDGDEIWGNVEWLDVIYSSSETFTFIHCLAISL